MHMTESNETLEDIERFLKGEVVGYLGLAADGEPYVVPINYAYIDRRILFHCAMQGKKLDFIRRNPKVCFAVSKSGGEVRRHGDGDTCNYDYYSVVCFGTARIVDDVEERRSVLNDFNRYFRPEAEEISIESAAKCGAVEIKVEEITARNKREKKRTFWSGRCEP